MTYISVSARMIMCEEMGRMWKK